MKVYVNDDLALCVDVGNWGYCTPWCNGKYYVSKSTIARCCDINEFKAKASGYDYVLTD